MDTDSFLVIFYTICFAIVTLIALNALHDLRVIQEKLNSVHTETLKNTNLEDVDLKDANLKGANLDGVNY